MPLKTNERQYRDLAQVLGTTQDNKRFDTDYYVEGYASTFDVPYLLYSCDGVSYYEQVDSTAFDGADMSDIIMQFDHHGTVMARLRNSTLIVEPDAHGLFIAADLSKSAQARDLYEAISNGLIDRMSWAFTVTDTEYDATRNLNIIHKVGKVYDVSAVSIPADQDTEISARDAINGAIDAYRLEQQALLDIRKRRLQLAIEIERTLK